MPHLTSDLSEQGLVIDISVGLSSARATTLRGIGDNVPDPIIIRAIIDTGASTSAVDVRVLEQLGINPTGETLIHTPSSGAKGKMCSQYDVSIIIPEIDISFDPLPIIGTHLNGGSNALIGLDILRKAMLMYNGVKGNFILVF